MKLYSQSSLVKTVSAVLLFVAVLFVMVVPVSAHTQSVARTHVSAHPATASPILDCLPNKNTFPNPAYNSVAASIPHHTCSTLFYWGLTQQGVNYTAEWDAPIGGNTCSIQVFIPRKYAGAEAHYYFFADQHYLANLAINQNAVQDWQPQQPWVFSGIGGYRTIRVTVNSNNSPNGYDYAVYAMVFTCY